MKLLPAVSLINVSRLMGAGHVRWPLPGWAVEGLPALIQTVLENRFPIEELLNRPSKPPSWPREGNLRRAKP